MNIDIISRNYRNKLSANVSPERALLTAERIVTGRRPANYKGNVEDYGHEIREMAEVLLTMVKERTAWIEGPERALAIVNYEPYKDMNNEKG